MPHSSSRKTAPTSGCQASTHGTRPATRGPIRGRILSLRIRLALGGVGSRVSLRRAGDTSGAMMVDALPPLSRPCVVGGVSSSILRTRTRGLRLVCRFLLRAVGGNGACAVAGVRMSSKAATGTARRRRRGCTRMASNCRRSAGAHCRTESHRHWCRGAAIESRRARCGRGLGRRPLRRRRESSVRC